MDKETDALLKIARERENKKDLLAYQKLKEISTHRKNIFGSTGHFRQNGKAAFAVGRCYTVSAERTRIRLAGPQSNAAR